MSELEETEICVSKDMLRVARGLACAFLHQPGSSGDLAQRGAEALGRKWPWLKRMARDLLEHFDAPLQATAFAAIVQWIVAHPDFVEAFSAQGKPPRLVRYFSYEPSMGEAPPPLANLGLPVLTCVGDVARWLSLASTELDWLADLGGWGARQPATALQHYTYHWRAKASGGFRLIEAPKPRLREIQRKILHDLLDKLPVHAAAQGCVRGRSTRSHAQVHAGSSVLVKMDLSDFFTSIRASRVHALFLTLGYGTEVSRCLTGLLTHCTPPAVLRSMPHDASATLRTAQAKRAWGQAFLGRHLPQGAPSSPALANLCAWRLDLRLVAAAAECQTRYTRYVDDLVFSGATLTPAHARRIALMMQGIIIEEGFTPHPHKTRVMTQAQAQRVTGLVVNVAPNVPRADYDRLKAILTNCLRHGPVSQNREGHADFRAYLWGCISYVRHINAARGARLADLFGRINWAAA